MEPAVLNTEVFMLKQYVPMVDARTPLHRTGEVVIARIGNYLEAGERCRPKPRPTIILMAGPCQHHVAGLTTKSHCLFNRAPRVELPSPREIGLDPRKRSYLWGPYWSRVCRIDVLEHLGWLDLDTVDFLRTEMRLPQWMVTSLMGAVIEARRCSPKPR